MQRLHPTAVQVLRRANTADPASHSCALARGVLLAGAARSAPPRTSHMTTLNLISPEVLARVDRNELQLFLLLGELRSLAEKRGDPDIVALSEALAGVLRDQMGLLEAIVEALAPEEPPPPRPRTRARARTPRRN